MLKYAKIMDEKTKLCSVGVGDDFDFYKSIGMTEMEIEQSYDGNYYVKGFTPAPNLDELKQIKLQEVNNHTEQKIIGGFVSNASGQAVKYDSDVDTQITMQGICINVNTPLFAEKYPNGCPVRGYAQGKTTKEIFMLTAEQVLKWQADLSMHIGNCKQQGWVLQAKVNACTIKEELDKIVLG